MENSKSRFEAVNRFNVLNWEGDVNTCAVCGKPISGKKVIAAKKFTRRAYHPECLEKQPD